MLRYHVRGKREAPELYDASHPAVSIIILNLNRPDMTIACLESLWEHTNGARYEVIVVDNGSSAQASEQLAAYPGPHRLIRLKVNRFFGEGNNIGAENARGQYLLFLNNDVIVKQGWLEPLLETFQKYPDAGCCGPKFIYPSGELQEAGALIDADGTAIQIGKFQNPDQARFNQRRVVDYVSAAAILMRKSDFEAVLGFDFRYEPAYYEDSDLCLKVATLGRKTYYVPASEVVHYENQTTSDPSHGLKLRTFIELNREKFTKRWGHFLQTGRHSEHSFGRDLVPAAPKTATRTAGFFTPYTILPGGSERYLLNLMELFASQDYAPILIVPEQYSRLRISSVLDSLGLKLPGIDIVTYAEAKKSKRYDIFFCFGNQLWPPSRGLGKHNIYCCQLPSKFGLDERQQIPWIESYSAIVCYSEFVEGFVRSYLEASGSRAIDIQVIYPPVGVAAKSATAERSGILGVGRFFRGGHYKQQDMMIAAMCELIERGLDTELHLVGSLHPEPEHREYANECRALARGLPVSFHIDASSEDLADLLRRSSVYWHGAGLGIDPAENPEQCEDFGISVAEAMSAGVIPIVVNNGGPSLIVQNGMSGFHYTSRAELVERTAWLLTAGEAEKAQLRDNAIKRAQMYSYAAFRERWLALLKKLQAG